MSAEKQFKLKTETFKHIESEIYGYWDSVNELKRLQEEILYSTPVIEGDGGRPNLPGDPTGRKATTMLTHRRMKQLEQITSAIKTIYDRLPPEKQEMVQLKYWTIPQTLTWEGIAQKIHISRRTALYWRNEIVYAIAAHLGWK